MEPTIRTGSNVVVRKIDPYTLEKDDIITFISKDQAIYGSANTHRILSVETDENGERFFVTKGDANGEADSIRVYPADVVGKVVFYIKSAAFSNIVGFLKTPYGLFFAIIMPLVVVSWLFMKDFRNSVKELQEEMNNAENISASQTDSLSEGKDHGESGK